MGRFRHLFRYGPDRLLGEWLFDLANLIRSLAFILSSRQGRIGLVWFSWGHSWRRWRIVKRTNITVPWAELGPIDVLFQDNYGKGYDG